MKTKQCKCGEVICVDDDNEHLLQDNWSCNGRTICREKMVNYIRYRISLASQVISVPISCVPDHVDRNIHNNLRSNLRVATPSENQANQKIRSDNVSGVPGISWEKKSKRWLVKLAKNNKQYRCGTRSEFRDAIILRNQKAVEFFGQFAVTYSEDTPCP